MNRSIVLYAEPKVTVFDMSRALQDRVQGESGIDHGALTVQMRDRSNGTEGRPYVRLFPVGSRYEDEADLERVAIANPQVFHIHFDSFWLLKEVLLALTDEFNLWIAHGELEPTPGAAVAARIRQQPGWNLGHTSVLPS